MDCCLIKENWHFIFEQCECPVVKNTQNTIVNDDCGANKEGYGVHVKDVDYCERVP
jgi:hypothetical protein